MSTEYYAPTPWEQTNGNKVVNWSDGIEVADAYSAADAAHIVKCVNAHDALLQTGVAADRFLTWFENFMGAQAMGDINCEQLTALRAALGRAQS